MVRRWKPVRLVRQPRRASVAIHLPALRGLDADTFDLGRRPHRPGAPDRGHTGVRRDERVGDGARPRGRAAAGSRGGAMARPGGRDSPRADLQDDGVRAGQRDPHASGRRRSAGRAGPVALARCGHGAGRGVQADSGDRSRPAAGAARVAGRGHDGGHGDRSHRSVLAGAARGVLPVLLLRDARSLPRGLRRLRGQPEPQRGGRPVVARAAVDPRMDGGGRRGRPGGVAPAAPPGDAAGADVGAGRALDPLGILRVLGADDADPRHGRPAGGSHPGAAGDHRNGPGTAGLADHLVAPLGVVPARSHDADGGRAALALTGAGRHCGGGPGGIRAGHAVVVPRHGAGPAPSPPPRARASRPPLRICPCHSPTSSAP